MRQLVLLYSLILAPISFAYPNPAAYLFASGDSESWTLDKRSADDGDFISLLKRGSRGTPPKPPPSSSPPQRVPSHERLFANTPQPHSSQRRASEQGQAVSSRSSGRRGETSVNSSPVRERQQASGGTSPGDKRPGRSLTNPRPEQQQKVASLPGNGMFTSSPSSRNAGSAQYLYPGGSRLGSAAQGTASVPLQQNHRAPSLPGTLPSENTLEAVNARYRAQREMFPGGFPEAWGAHLAPPRLPRQPEAPPNAGRAQRHEQLAEAMSGAAIRAARQPPRAPITAQQEQEQLAAGREWLAGLRNQQVVGPAPGSQQGGRIVDPFGNPQAWGASFGNLRSPPRGRGVGAQVNAAQAQAHENVGIQIVGWPGGNGRGAAGQAMGGQAAPGHGRGAGGLGVQPAGQGAFGALFEGLQPQDQQPQMPMLPHVSSATSLQEHFAAPKEDSKSP